MLLLSNAKRRKFSTAKHIREISPVGNEVLFQSCQVLTLLCAKRVWGKMIRLVFSGREYLLTAYDFFAAVLVTFCSSLVAYTRCLWRYPGRYAVYVGAVRNNLSCLPSQTWTSTDEPDR